MSLITAEELARGLIIGTFGGAAGLCTVAFPGSVLWLLPAGLAVGGCALTVPEVRQEVIRALPARAELPALADKLRRALPVLPAGRQVEDQAAAPLASRRSPRPAQAEPAGQALPPREWLRAVNDLPDDNPHMTVVGPSGCGKTTFVSATLSQRPGRVVVLTPKVSPGAWRGAEVVTLSDDLSYAPLADALNDLQTEAKQRTLALRRGEPLEPMTVVLDELPELHAEIPGAGKFAVRLSRWGRELGMRQVVLATSDDALNIPGWAATRSNYVRVELGKPAPDGRRPAMLDDGQSRRPLDLGNVKGGADRAQLRPWRAAHVDPFEGETTQLTPIPSIPPVSATEASALLASYLDEAIPPHQDAEGMVIHPIPGNRMNDHSSVTVEPGTGPGVTLNVIQTITGKGGRQADNSAYAQALIALYRAAGADGITFTKAYAQHKGTKEIAFTAWQEGKAAAQKSKEEAPS
jgi:hypothetical protein